MEACIVLKRDKSMMSGDAINMFLSQVRREIWAVQSAADWLDRLEPEGTVKKLRTI